MQISEQVSGRVDLCVDDLARRCTNGRGWVCMRMGGCACRWVGVHADGWVCMRIGGLCVDK